MLTSTMLSHSPAFIFSHLRLHWYLDLEGGNVKELQSFAHPMKHFWIFEVSLSSHGEILLRIDGRSFRHLTR